MGIEDRRTGSIVDWVIAPTVTSVTAPTVAEITAGTRLEDGIVDTIDTPRSGSSTDVSGASSRENADIAATITNGPVTGTAWREFDGTDTYWAALDDAGDPPTTQYLIAARGGFTGGTPTAADVVDVYTVQIMSRGPVGPVKGDGQRFEFEMSILAVNFDSVVAA